MSSNLNIPNAAGNVAPTPQNTPLTTGAPISQLSRPTVAAIDEEPSEDGPNLTANRSGLDPAQSAVLAQLVQGRLAGLLGKSSGYVESLPVEVRKNVEALKGVQVQYEVLQKEYKREVLALERKYHDLYRPLYERRFALTSGHAAPTPEEVAAGEAQSLKDNPDAQPLPSSESPAGAPPSASKPGTGIPEFWLTALRNHNGISELITERDVDALKHLVDVRVSYIPETPTQSGEQGFKLEFVFAPNEFFTDTILTKTYFYRDEVGYEGDFVYARAEGTAIAWKEDKDLTKSFEIKKQRNKNTNRTRIIRKAHPTDSFFNFFAPPVPPSEEALEKDEVDPEELQDLEERLEIDYQIGEDIKERVVPRAVDYFTGKALEFDDDLLGESDEDDEFDEDDEDEDDFEDEDDEDDDE